MQPSEASRYAALSPFELKNTLVALASHRGERMMLNAGRGNPNWVALEPRAAAARLAAFAIEESARVAVAPGLGGLPKKRGIAGRLRAHLGAAGPCAGADLIGRGIDLARDAHGIDPDRLVGEWVDGVLGDHYPLPVRMLEHAETLVRAHLVAELFGGDADAGAFDLFAVEGASAGIVYLFQSLVNAGLLRRGDRIALGVPIFTPYLEVPRLPGYEFEVVEVMQDETAGWRYPPAEIDKLRDPAIRLFLAVNPSNPTAVAMDAATVERVAAIATGRDDLIVVTDDVYAPFVEGFRSLAAAAPRHTVVLYSFSKFWGATGLRLGVVGLHRANAIDARLLAGGASAADAARRRYGTLSTDPARLKLIDRMVADSRAVGLNHTAGLSGPQQVQMSLFALDALLDAGGARKRVTRAVVRRRWERLHRGAGLAAPHDPLCTHYYATLDLVAIGRTRHGAAFAAWLDATVDPIEVVVRLAREHGVVLLPGGGFDAPRLSVRVSFANLPDAAYEPIGRAIAQLLDAYHTRFATETTR